MLLDASQVPPRKCAGGGGRGERYLPTVGIAVGAPFPAVCLSVFLLSLHSRYIYPPAVATLLGSAVS